MKICFVIPTLKFSGAEKVLTAIATYMSRQGHEVHVILTFPAPVHEEAAPFPVHYVVSDGVRPMRVLRRAIRLRRTVAAIAPEVTISFGYGTSVNCIPAFLGNGVPHIVCERSNPSYDPPGRSAKWLRRLLYPLASGFVFQTETIRDLFSPSIRQRSFVIPNPVVDSFDAVPGEYSGNSEPNIVAVGRLSDRDKNQSCLIRAFASLAKEFPTWTLELYGEGPDRGLFEDMIEEAGLYDRALLRGHVDRPETALRRADIFVLPSRTEGMPNALIEAMAAGVACVASNCSGGGVSALITSDINGLICPNDDSHALAMALGRLMGDSRLRQSLGRAARNIRESHSLERIGNQWLEVIRAQIG